MKSVILRMALRNILEHRRKSLTVGILVAIAAFVFSFGSNLLESATAGIGKSYRERFTGDLYITAKSNKSITAFGWADQDSMMEAIPLLPRHAEIKKHAASLPGVEAVTSRAVTFAQVSTGSGEAKGGTLLFGVDPAEYAHVFPEAFRLSSGSSFGADGAGMGNGMGADNGAGGSTPVSTFLASGRLDSSMGESASPGRSILLSTIGAGSSIRETRVSGILRGDGANPMLDMVSYVDIGTLRGLLGYYADSASGSGSSSGSDSGVGAGASAGTGTTAVRATVNAAAAAATAAAATEDEASLFGGSIVTEQSTGAGVSVEDIFRSLRGRADVPDADAYQYIIIKTRNGADAASIQKSLGVWLESRGIEASVHGWLEGAGMIASTIFAIKSAFYYIFLIIAIVSLLIIMNALVISVTERTAEIGTMRAIGASRKFVEKLIVSETMILSLISGMAGIVLSSICVMALSSSGIAAPNFFFRILFGGDVLKPAIQADGMAVSIAAVLAVGALASLYPTKVALRVNPSTAMQRE